MVLKQLHFLSHRQFRQVVQLCNAAFFVFIVLLCVAGSSLTTAVLSVCLVAAGGRDGGVRPGRHCAGRVENMEF